MCSLPLVDYVILAKGRFCQSNILINILRGIQADLSYEMLSENISFWNEI